MKYIISLTVVYNFSNMRRVCKFNIIFKGQQTGPSYFKVFTYIFHLFYVVLSLHLEGAVMLKNILVLYIKSSLDESMALLCWPINCIYYVVTAVTHRKNRQNVLISNCHTSVCLLMSNFSSQRLSSGCIYDTAVSKCSAIRICTRLKLSKLKEGHSNSQ